MDEFNRIIEFAIKNDVELYTSMPSGWRRVMGALTAPRGSMWIYNGKSNFSKERKTALLVKKDCQGRGRDEETEPDLQSVTAEG